MKIPRFWAKGTVEAVGLDGRPAEVSCWRWSDLSEDDARESALVAARRVLAAIRAGRKPDRYAYGDQPLREEVLNTLEDQNGDVVAAVTRNAAGCLVLNAQRVMFIDIDFPDVSTGASLLGLLARLFGRGRPSPRAEQLAEAKARIEEFVARRPGWGIRLYQTQAGLRGMVTHAPLEAESDESIRILTELGADPLYVRLCQVQKCFRARLTPKPWRCGHYATHARYPMEDPVLIERDRKWRAQYESRHRGYATCRWLGQFGSAVVHLEVERIAELHDFATKCHEPLPLA